MSVQPGQLLRYDYCVKDSQRLADLTGIRMDLQTAIRYCDLHIEIDPTESGISVEETSRREHTRQALCRAALVMYGRSWGWGGGVRSGLGTEYREKLSDDLRGFHETVRQLRNMWVAHAVNHFDDVRVNINVRVQDDGTLTIEGVSIASHHIGGFVQAWMMQFRDLALCVLSVVHAEIAAESERLSVSARSMPLQEVLARARVDHVPLGGTVLQPKKTRKRFPE